MSLLLRSTSRLPWKGLGLLLILAPGLARADLWNYLDSVFERFAERTAVVNGLCLVAGVILFVSNLLAPATTWLRYGSALLGFISVSVGIVGAGAGLLAGSAGASLLALLTLAAGIGNLVLSMARARRKPPPTEQSGGRPDAA